MWHKRDLLPSAGWADDGQPGRVWWLDAPESGAQDSWHVSAENTRPEMEIRRLTNTEKKNADVTVVGLV